MQIVINIPKSLYANLQKIQNGSIATKRILECVRNGTPLPKGHGRLIDADAFQKTYCKENCGDRPCVDAMDRCTFIGELLLAPTIIEADKESEVEG